LNAGNVFGNCNAITRPGKSMGLLPVNKTFLGNFVAANIKFPGQEDSPFILFYPPLHPKVYTRLNPTILIFFQFGTEYPVNPHKFKILSNNAISVEYYSKAATLKNLIYC
jgi:hypothetical protein